MTRTRQEEKFSSLFGVENQQQQLFAVKLYLNEFPDINFIYADWTLLHVAAIRDNFMMAEYLIQQGINLNRISEGGNAMHNAATSENRNGNQKKIIKLLLDNGIDMTQQIDGPYKQTPFILALQCGKLEIVEYLESLAPNTCVDSIDFQERGLHFAAGNENDLKVLDFAIQHSFEYDKQDEYGDTPLICTRGEKEQVNKLLALGVDINHQNHSGATVVHSSVEHEIEAAINNNTELDISNTENLLMKGYDKTIRTFDRKITADELAIHGYAGGEFEEAYRELFAKY